MMDFKKLYEEKIAFKDEIIENMYEILILNGRDTENEYAYFDAKCVQKIESNYDLFQYQFVNRTAWQAVWNFLKPKLQTKTLDQIAGAILDSDRPNGAKGSEVEFYIISKSLKTGTLSIKPLDKKKKSRNSRLLLMIFTLLISINSILKMFNVEETY